MLFGLSNAPNIFKTFCGCAFWWHFTLKKVWVREHSPLVEVLIVLLENKLFIDLNKGSFYDQKIGTPWVSGAILVDYE